MGQMQKLTDWLKTLFNGGNKKELIEKMVIIIIIGAVFIIAGGSLFKKDVSGKTDGDKANLQDSSVKDQQTGNGDDIEKQIEAILSKIEGAGKVEVMITYAAGKELVPAYDTKKTENSTEEKDSGGGTRSIKQNNSESSVIFEETQSGGKTPVILKELLPEVKGVVVVADGAGDAVVRENLSRAVQVLLDIQIHKIQVYPSAKK